MAFFKFRPGNSARPKTEAQPPNMESIRQRAKYRLAGATLLVLLAVIALPLLFDRQPRPLTVNAPIVMPEAGKMAPLSLPDSAEKTASTDSVAKAPAASAAQTMAPAKPDAQPTKAAEPVAKDTASKTQTAPANVKTEPRQSESQRVLALLAGQTDKTDNGPKADTSKIRFVIQVGAFSEDVHVREVRAKLERAGLKTYTQIAQTKDGQRIRVRVGPFSSQSQADLAAEKIKKLQLPATVLKL